MASEPWLPVTPASGSGSAYLALSVTSTGALTPALDDIGVACVTICRAAVAGEVAPFDANCGGTAAIFVGTAQFVDGARPDVGAGCPCSDAADGIPTPRGTSTQSGAVAAR